MFGYFLKKTLRNKGLIFWTFIFPIALMTCFKVAFSNIYSSDVAFDPVDAVYVCQDEITFEELLNEFISDNNLDEYVAMAMKNDMLTEISDLWKAADYEELEKRFEDGTYNEEELQAALSPVIEEYFKELGEDNGQDISDYIVLSDSFLNKLDRYAYGFIFEMIASDSDCFNLTTKDSLEEAREALKNKEAKMILIVKDKDVRIELSEEYSDMEANIATAFLQTYKTEYQVMREMILGADYSEIFNMNDTDDINATLSTSFGNDFSMKEIAKAKADIYDETPNPYNWYYYSTIVMGIMFNILTGIMIVSDAQADITTGAMRISLSSAKKSRLIVNMFFSRYVVCIVITLLQIIIANVVFDIPIGKRFPELLLFDLVANMFALSAGLFCGLYFKGKITERENKANALLMTSVFLSGEMVCALPGIIQQKAPIINEINPATVLNFTFYRLVYYGNLNSFYMSVIKIVIASLILLAISVMKLRRQKYASI